uniref:Uncharacterized protein n=1 Tax=Panagrolaimus sp. ES5 TaxID=591445 RepID=A0AC34GBW3_9BILA
MFQTSLLLLLFSTLLFLCSNNVAAQNDTFHTIRCQHEKMSANSLPSDISLNANYATTIRYTNWNTAQTALIMEKKFSDIFFAQKIDRSQTENYVIGNDSTLIYNETSCSNTSNSAFSPDLYPVDPLIKTNVLKNTYKIGEIIEKIMKTQFYYQSNVDMAVVGGVDTVAWVGCNFNVTNTTGIQVAVFYSGNQKGQLPYSKNFKNPVALSIHFSTFDESNKNYTIKTHTSIDITGLELTVEAEKEKYASPPRGQYCENMTLYTLPGTIPNRFGASIDFVNTKTKQVDNIEIMYDNVLKVTHYSLDFQNDLDIPFVAGMQIPAGLSRASIYRDFNYGLQYVMSKDGRICKDVKALDASFGDCITVDGKVQMVTPENILLNVTNAQFYKYGKLILEGIEVESYIAKGNQSDGGNFVAEVNFIPASWNIEGVKGQQQLHSIVHYHKDKDMKLLYETYIHFDTFQNYTALGPLWLKNNVFPCSTDSVEDNFFYVNLQNVSLKDIQTFGTENVECALAEALSEAVNVSVFRISYFMFKEAGKSAIACFLMGKKSNVAPTQTAYLKKELSVAEFKEALNKTILSGGFVTKLITEDLKPAAININRLGVINTSDEPIPAPTFVGYSGGSMFILATFTFIFGAAIAVGTYIFYTKRRTISGMTYQVFE